MNDLTSLRDLGDTLDQELRGPSPQLRHRVLTGIGQQRARIAGRQPWSARRRLAVTGVLAMALAAALLAASTLRLWGASPAASAQAAQILHLAAVAAQRQPALTAGPSQFIYVQSVETAATLTGSSDGRITSVHLSTNLREIWNSVSGTRDGLLREQPRSGTAPGQPTGPWQTTSLAVCSHSRTTPVAGAALTPPGRCVPQPAVPTGLPTSIQAMVAYLYRNSHG